MNRIAKTFGLIALAAAAFTTPTMAQTLSIGPDGVRVIDPRNDQRPDDRNGDFNRRDRDRDRDRGRPEQRGEVSEREAVRIARGEGVREVDNVRRTRDSYRVDGTDRRGDDIRVVVDRRSGAVIAVR